MLYHLENELKTHLTCENISCEFNEIFLTFDEYSLHMATHLPNVIIADRLIHENSLQWINSILYQLESKNINFIEGNVNYLYGDLCPLCMNFHMNPLRSDLFPPDYFENSRREYLNENSRESLILGLGTHITNHMGYRRHYKCLPCRFSDNPINDYRFFEIDHSYLDHLYNEHNILVSNRMDASFFVSDCQIRPIENLIVQAMNFLTSMLDDGRSGFIILSCFIFISLFQS